MIAVQLYEAPEGRGDYYPVASLIVLNDGTYRVDDPEGKLLTELHVLIPLGGGQSGFRRVSLAEDPATWARHLGSIYRTGYWVPVTIRDDGGIAPESRYSTV
ncbi:hypothetical protein [Nocardioides sp. InS609-2]|uniref:hypothetical protein n=1 Tax=Nocardioides sp. InS609-2 TaxID=2760705 RepID=UPI0020BD57AA|nr:hypothetical protein [Nocardioides sp. InS609-2]